MALRVNCYIPSDQTKTEQVKNSGAAAACSAIDRSMSLDFVATSQDTILQEQLLAFGAQGVSTHDIVIGAMSECTRCQTGRDFFLSREVGLQRHLQRPFCKIGFTKH